MLYVAENSRGVFALRSYTGASRVISGNIIINNLISGISFYHYWKHRISEKIPNISYVQIIQTEINEITVKILPDKKYSDKDEKIIINEMYKLVGNMKISFKYINKRPIEQKWRFTISKLSNNEILKYLG